MNPAFVPGQTILVRKLKWPTRKEQLSYPATVIEVTDRCVVVGAESTLDGLSIDGLVITRTDWYTEHYYSDRWFNVYHIASTAGETKAWYCNVAMPFEASELGVAFVDLYLDLFVHPDGHYTVLDEEEFEAMASELGDRVVKQAREALNELIRMAEQGLLPQPGPHASTPPR